MLRKNIGDASYIKILRNIWRREFRAMLRPTWRDGMDDHNIEVDPTAKCIKQMFSEDFLMNNP